MNALQALPRDFVPIATRFERAVGTARIAVRLDRGRTRVERLYQAGSAKVRFPRIAVAGAPLEAVLLNTAGGMTGGDRFRFEAATGEGAAATITTQAAERVYRRTSGVATVETELAVGPGARLDWLPQETILFDRSALARRLVADVDATATLLAVESFVLGRAAMGERVSEVLATDAWRIRRGGKLVFADTTRLDGDAGALMAGGATGGGATAFATLVLVAPKAEAMLDAARAALAEWPGEGGASAWNGILVARLIAPSGQSLRAGLVALIEMLRGRPMPRVWSC